MPPFGIPSLGVDADIVGSKRRHAECGKEARDNRAL
jgi:hypothetical protein